MSNLGLFDRGFHEDQCENAHLWATTCGVWYVWVMYAQLPELSSKLIANELSAKLAGFKRNWTEDKIQFARAKQPSCRNSWRDCFQGINHTSLLTHLPHSHQGGCAGQADFLLSYWHRLCEAPAWHPQPASLQGSTALQQCKGSWGNRGVQILQYCLQFSS